MTRQSLLRVLNIPTGGSGETPIDWLLRDEFTTAESAPIASPRTSEPGPGTLTAVQVDGQMSISGSKLVIPAQTTPAWNDLGIYYAAGFARSPGLAFMTLVNFSTVALYVIGWGTVGPTAPNYAGQIITHSAFGRELYSDSLFQRTRIAMPTNTDIIVTLVLRSTGVYYFEGLTLMAVGYSGTQATMYPKIYSASSALTNDYIRVAQLGAGFADDDLTIYSDATPTAGDVATAGQDAVHYIQWTVGAVETFELRIRYTDDDNCIVLRCNQAASTTALLKRIAGVETSLGSVATTWTVGATHRVSMRYNGNFIVASTDNNHFSLAVTDAFNSSVTGAKISGAATLANWHIYPVLLTGANADELTRHTNPFLGA